MIKRAFNHMRADGLIARPGWTPQGDVAEELVNRAAELRAKGARIDGAVFFTKEDVTNRAACGAFPLHFGPVPTPEGQAAGLPVDLLGKKIVSYLTKHGVYCEWDGDPGHPIIVKEN